MQNQLLSVAESETIARRGPRSGEYLSPREVNNSGSSRKFTKQAKVIRQNTAELKLEAESNQTSVNPIAVAEIRSINYF